MTRPALHWIDRCLIVAGMGLLLGCQLSAPLELQDDHRIVDGARRVSSIRNPADRARDFLVSWWGMVVDDLTLAGRFRPGAQVFDVGLPYLYDAEALRLRVHLLILGLVVTAGLHAAGTLLFGSRLAAAVFTLGVMLAPDPGPITAWYRLGPKESVGMAAVAGALVAMGHLQSRWSRAWEWLSLVSVTLAVLTKEPFALLVPAFAILRVWVETRRNAGPIAAAVRRLRPVLCAYGLVWMIALGGIVAAVVSSGRESYGGESLERTPDELLRYVCRDLVRTPSLAMWMLPCAVAGAIGARRPRAAPGPGLFVATGLASWLVPQYLLYGTRGGMWDHYWLPCVVGLAALNALAVAAVASRERVWPKYLVLVVVCLWCLNAVRIDATAILNFGARARAQNELVQEVAGALRQNGRLIVVAGKGDFERAFSFVYFVRARRPGAWKAYLYDTSATPGTGRFATGINFTEDVKVTSLPVDSLSTVVLLSEAEPGDEVWRDHWLERGGLTSHAVRARQRYFSMKRLGWVEKVIVFRWANPRLRPLV